MGYCRLMGYGVQFPAHRGGGPKNVWDFGGYGLWQAWVMRVPTVLSLPPPLVGPNVWFVTDDPINLNRNPIKLDGILLKIQAPTSTQYVHVR